MIRFVLKTEVSVANGLFRELPQWLQKQGVSHPAFLIDEGFARAPLCQGVLEQVRAAFPAPLLVVQARGTAEPTYDYLNELAAVFRAASFDFLVGIGGGSCMDLAKALAALKTNPGNALEYRGFDKLKVPAVPSLLIPTTAGTGSEVTINASFVDTEKRAKLGINGRYMSATFAFLDGETTVSCPYKAALGSAADALVHSLESFCCKQHNRITRLFSVEAFRLLAGSMRALKDDPADLERRLDLLLGAYYAGAALFNSGSGIAGGLSYPLGVYYQVPHGIGGATFCLGVMRHNLERGYDDYAALLPALQLPDAAPSPHDQALAVHRHLQALFDYLEVPRKLSAFGIGPGRYDHVLEICQGLQGAFDQNPVPFSAKTDLPGFLRNYF